jgi:hypothetical protein
VIDVSADLLEAGPDLEGQFAPEGHYSAETCTRVARTLAGEVTP